MGTETLTTGLSLAERFRQRFAGLERGHGHAVLKEVPSSSTNDKNGKRPASHTTVHEPVTTELWTAHLAGEYSLGIVPIRDDATCVFGAIDIDSYQVKEMEQLAEDIQKAGVPLILCRTKSGGGHLYLFTREPVAAELIRGKLMEWAVILGYSGVEVFPKQTRLAGVNDWGNWINMPYFGGAKTDRYAIVNGKKLSPEKFLDLADLMALDAEGLQNFQLEVMNEFQGWLEQGPPCLQTLAKRGFGEGSRNNALFNIGVYLRKRFEDDWEQKLDEYNNKFMHPPLGHKEVASVVKHLSRKVYNFKCGDQPIVSVCNRQICLSRRFGVGAGDGDPGVIFGPMVKIETQPPLWIWDVDGARIELTTQEIKDQQRFHSRCMEVLNKWPNLVKPQQWAKIVRDKLASVDVQQAPPDASQEGQMWSYLEMYCTRAPARQKEDLLKYKPWRNEGRIYIHSGNFRQFLEQNRMRVTEKTLWSWFRKRDAIHHFFNINGRGINLWSIPEFPEQVLDFEPIPMPEEL